jgi:CTP:molybdopterin cytidylyltransferase MocA
MKTGCILLAAGAGVRFGGGKLKAPLAGRPLAEYILSALPQDCFSHCLMVAADRDLLGLAERYGIPGIINDRPELGVARSVRMGLTSLPDADASMFCVCDQPLLTRDTLAGMAAAYEAGSILTLSSHKKRGNPVIFPSSLFGELKNLSAEGSGKTVISAHPELVKTYDIPDKTQLMDADTPAQLRQIESLILAKSGHSR